MGVSGNRNPSFKDDLEKQLLDFEAIRPQVNHFCIVGDFNISFSDNYYYTKNNPNRLSDHKGVMVEI